MSISAPATRPASPLGLRPERPVVVKATSAPQSRRNSFIKLHPKKADSNLPPIPRAAGDFLLRRYPSATIGTAPTGRGVLTSSTAPSPASYLVSDTFIAKNRAAPSATFGSAPRSVGDVRPRRLAPIDAGTPLIGREAAAAQQPHSYHATFGTGRTELTRRPDCGVHSYLDHKSAQPFQHSFAATIAQGKPPRPRSGCKVHSYLNQTNTQPKKHAFHATFGTEARFTQPCGIAHLWAPQPLGLPMQPAVAAA